MKTSAFAIGGMTAIMALGCGSAALAQAKKPAAAAAPAPAAAAPAPSAAAPNLTATIPGVCIIQRERILATSTVGKSVQTRMGQLQSQVQAELNGEEQTFQTDAKAYEAKKATLQPAQQQQQEGALQQRYQALQQKAALRQKELEDTQQKAMQRVWTESVPLISATVTQHNCGVVLDANAIMVANPQMDLTDGVVTALNGKITQFAFDRENEAAAAGAQR